MRKFKSGIILLFSFILVTASIKVEALTSPIRIPSPTPIDSLEDLINIVSGLIRPAFLLTFIAMILYGAYTWLTAGADDKKVQSAKQIIVAAIVGFSIAVFAPAIVDIVARFLGIPSFSIGS
jgi:hypothetical protein